MSDPQGPRSGFVTLVGWTNVGKSSLLNRLVGAKLAAVADVSQTTRHRITGAVHDPARGQIVFVDTPGIHRPRHRMNRAMVETARHALDGVDLVVMVADAEKGLGPGDREVAELLARIRAPRLLALNKVDRVKPKSKLLPMIEVAVAELELEEVVPVSALTGDGCDELLEAIWNRLPAGAPPYDEDFLTDQSERALAAEWIREQLLRQTREELPHATAVSVEEWHEREDGLVRIEATILVERTSQKKIVIGREGEMLKRVGTAAREELERQLGRRVYLQLWVRVREHWRDDPGLLRRLGIEG